MYDDVAHEKDRGEQGHHFQHEHHWVAGERARVELAEGLPDRGKHDLRVQQCRDRHPLANFRRFHCEASDEVQNTVPACIASCSTIGPSASAGKNVRPPTIRMTPTKSPTNNAPVVGNVPSDGGTDFFAASEPAMAIVGMIIQKRPTNIAMAPVRL